jgi:thioredoxin-related protein
MKKVLLALIAASLFSCNHTPSLKTGLEGKTIPGFDLLLADSTTHFNTETIPIGKPVVFFLFSPECPYCRAQMTNIVTHIKTLKNISFYLLTSYPFAEVKAFAKHYELYKYSNISVGIDHIDYFRNYYKAEGVPYIVIYNKEKKMENAFIGQIPIEQLKDIAEK